MLCSVLLSRYVFFVLCLLCFVELVCYVILLCLCVVCVVSYCGVLCFASLKGDWMER